MTRKQLADFNRNRPTKLDVLLQRLRWELASTFWFVFRWSLMVWFVKTFLLTGVTFWVAS